MRLQPYQTFLLCFALFMTGLLVALMLAHGHPEAPAATPFEVPF
jgi:hypothetical protein